ncbi:2,5-didehydrogluconate reductase DkgB [Pendulispora albinea]|uniref:2,5-didehydrogluconate reductase DkgB n=1 Tax=Pendulispora albinea TaxID=2741071 RepID=A0ABZ2LVP3_9BACT
MQAKKPYKRTMQDIHGGKKSPIPTFGLGTFRLKGDVVVQSILDGLEVGYRHIDTAQIYGNEADVGRAISRAGVPRKELFVTTKIWTANLARTALVPSLKKSLEDLRLRHVDLTLIHWPSPRDTVPLGETLGALLEAREQGLTKRIGISNFPIRLVERALEVVDPDILATNQVEVHPFLQNTALRDYSARKGIAITAYMPLAYGKVMADPVLRAIAQKHGVTPAQISIAWLLKLGMSVIPSSTKKANLAANLEAEKITLDGDDMGQIAALDRGERLTNPEFSPVWDL